MRSIQGNLSLMSVPDLMQWADHNKRTGTLTLRHHNHEKKFYIQDGKVILVSSDKSGEKLSEFLLKTGAISPDAIREALKEAEQLEVSFIGYILAKEIISREDLQKILNTISERALIDSLKWETGQFEFIDYIPPTILNGPLILHTSFLVMESLRIFDETSQHETIEPAHIVAEITHQIQMGAVEIPPIPDIVHRLAEQLQRDDLSIVEIVDTVTDQILASKILRISNSPYYGHRGQVTSLQDAFIYMGLKSIFSIVAVHALSDFCPKNAAEIKKVLHHCLTTAYVAKQIAYDELPEYNELAFTCSLLHDIGKTLMLNLLNDYTLPNETKAQLVAEHHQDVGYILAEKWNLPDEIKAVIKYHHDPAEAGEHRQLVELVALADTIAKREFDPAATNPTFTQLSLPDSYLQLLVDDLVNIEKNSRDIIF